MSLRVSFGEGPGGDDRVRHASQEKMGWRVISHSQSSSILALLFGLLLEADATLSSSLKATLLLRRAFARFFR